MSNEDLVKHIEGIGLKVDTLDVAGTGRYIVIRDYVICAGRLRGQRIELAIQWMNQVPYVAPSALHVRPHLVAMGTASSQGSPIGPEWQYLSRVLRVPPTPTAMMTHIATVLAEL